MWLQRMHCCVWLCFVALYYQAGISSVRAWGGNSGAGSAQSWSPSKQYHDQEKQNEGSWDQGRLDERGRSRVHQYQPKQLNQDLAIERTGSRDSREEYYIPYEQDRSVQRSSVPPQAGSSGSGQSSHSAATRQGRNRNEYDQFSASPDERDFSQLRTAHKAGVHKSGHPQESEDWRRTERNPLYDIFDDNEPIENFMERPDAAVPQCKSLPQRPVDFVFTLNPQSTLSYLNVSNELKERYIPELVQEIAIRYKGSRFGAATFGHMHAEGCFNVTVPLTPDPKRFTRRLRNKVNISFGGRSPELALLGAAMAATSEKLGWTSGDGSEHSRIRVVLLTTDDISALPSAEDIASPFLQLNGNARDSCHVRLPAPERVGSILDRDNTFLIVMPSGREELRQTWNTYASEANYFGRARVLVAPLDVKELSGVVLRFLKTFRVAQCIHSVAVEQRLAFTQELAARAATAPPTPPAPVDPEVVELMRQDNMLRKAKSGYLSSTWVQNSTISRPSSKRGTTNDNKRKNKENKKKNNAVSKPVSGGGEGNKKEKEAAPRSPVQKKNDSKLNNSVSKSKGAFSKNNADHSTAPSSSTRVPLTQTATGMSKKADGMELSKAVDNGRSHASAILEHRKPVTTRVSVFPKTATSRHAPATAQRPPKTEELTERASTKGVTVQAVDGISQRSTVVQIEPTVRKETEASKKEAKATQGSTVPVQRTTVSITTSPRQTPRVNNEGQDKNSRKEPSKQTLNNATKMEANIIPLLTVPSVIPASVVTTSTVTSTSAYKESTSLDHKRRGDEVVVGDTSERTEKSSSTSATQSTKVAVIATSIPTKNVARKTSVSRDHAKVMGDAKPKKALRKTTSTIPTATVSSTILKSLVSHLLATPSAGKENALSNQKQQTDKPVVADASPQNTKNRTLVAKSSTFVGKNSNGGSIEHTTTVDKPDASQKHKVDTQTVKIKTAKTAFPSSASTKPDSAEAGPSLANPALVTRNEKTEDKTKEAVTFPAPGNTKPSETSPKIVPGKSKVSWSPMPDVQSSKSGDNSVTEKAENTGARRTPAVSPTETPGKRETFAPTPTSTSQAKKETVTRPAVVVLPTKTPEKREPSSPKPTSTTTQMEKEETMTHTPVGALPVEKPRKKAGFGPEETSSPEEPTATLPSAPETPKKREEKLTSTTRNVSKPLTISQDKEATTAPTTAAVLSTNKPGKQDIETMPASVGNSPGTTKTERTSTTSTTTTTTTTASGSQAGKIAAVSSAGAAVVAAVGGVLGYTKLFNKPPVPPIDFGEGMDVPQTEEVERDLVAGVNFA